MRHLNYSHLQYFWAVAREGSMAAAAEAMHITPQTISGQLRMLEQAMGRQLFNRVGRRLELTDFGEMVFEYADEIFTLGAELANVVHGESQGGALTFKVGMVSSMPKLIAERILAPAFEVAEPIRLKCYEASLSELLGDLATHKLDIVLSDQPLQQGLSLRAYNHRLGESGLSFFASEALAESASGAFPDCLNELPFLLPTAATALRRRIDDWFDSIDVVPNIVGEIADSALMKALGEAGVGVFMGPTAIEKEICTMYRTRVIGQTDALTENYYAISPERKLKHPAVVKITEQARINLFAHTQWPKAEAS
ncbi:MAG: transcriptional activator NhaR [Pseudomonadota bacterium]